MLNKIALIIPTRERPDQVAIQAKELTSLTGKFADIHYVIDGDHANEHEYSRALGEFHHITHFQPWRGLSGTLNTMGLKLSQYYNYVGFIGDDHFPKTFGWDGKLLEIISRTDTLIAYGSDGQPALPSYDHGFPPMTWWVMDSDLLHALGQMVPYVLSHTCVDDYVWQLGYRSSTLSYSTEVLFEHQHWFWGKGEKDESYERSSEHNNRIADNLKWLDYQKFQLPHDVVMAQKLRRSNDMIQATRDED